MDMGLCCALCARTLTLLDLAVGQYELVALQQTTLTMLLIVTMGAYRRPVSACAHDGS